MFEKHLNTILVSVITVAILWVGKSVSDLREGSARLEERIISVSRQLEQANISDMNRRVSNNETKIELLEQRMNRIGS